MSSHSVRARRAAVRAYMVEHGITSYTAGLRAFNARTADTAYRPDTVLVDPTTGCWRSWAAPSIATLPTEVADDGEVLHSPLYFGGETFHDHGLQLRRGEAAVAWVRELGAAVGSVHRDGQQCGVCHDNHDYGAPDTGEVLQHRAHQVAAAFERLIGVTMGMGVNVTAGHDGELLVATLHLTDAARDGGRLRAVKWTAKHGWRTVAEDGVEAGTLLGWDTWQPRRVAEEIARAVRRHEGGSPQAEPGRASTRFDPPVER